MPSTVSGTSASASAADEYSDYDGTTTTPNSSSSVPPLPPISVAAPPAASMMTIRYSGRAHIRGKIRRIWRPRYLELCDNGLVRYFELPSPSSSSAVVANVMLGGDFSSSVGSGSGGDFGGGGAEGHAGAADVIGDDVDIDMEQRTQDLKHFNMILKDTLVVYHARIIDVTTLRDIHVGLPKGCYGFLFRGQRSSFFSINNNVVDLLPSPSSSQQNDLLYNNQTPSPRDYFCAVGSLEEAQAWVVALQWAADICKRNNYYLQHQRQLSSSSSTSFDHRGVSSNHQNQNRNRATSASGNGGDGDYYHDDDDDVDDDFVMTHDNNSSNSTAAVSSNNNKRTGMMINNCGMPSSSNRTSSSKAAGPSPQAAPQTF